jgi:FAD/FMN-containing dehydrogenase
MLLRAASFESLMRCSPRCARALRWKRSILHRPCPAPCARAHGRAGSFEQRHPYYVVAEYAQRGRGFGRGGDGAFEACAFQNGWASDGVLTRAMRRRPQLWRLREGITESLAPYRPYKNDCLGADLGHAGVYLAETQALLREAYPDFEWSGSATSATATAHQRTQPDGRADAEFRRAVRAGDAAAGPSARAHGGSISAEHGNRPGQEGLSGSTRSAAEIALMRGIRRALAPTASSTGKGFDP